MSQARQPLGTYYVRGPKKPSKIIPMRRQLAVGTLALGMVAGVAGCGGSSTYSLAHTESCFKGKGYQAVPLANQLLPGANGNLRIALGPNFGDEYVFIVFGRSHDDAVMTENKAVGLALKAFERGPPLHAGRGAPRRRYQPKRFLLL